MKTTTLSLYALVPASAALIAVAAAGGRDPEPPTGKAPRAFHQAIQVQVLQHINPKESLANRFSRALLPMPSKYYEVEIAGVDGGGNVEFRIVHVDTTTKKPTLTPFTTGNYDHETGQVFLFDAAKGKRVPALEHPAIGKGATS